MHQLQLVHESYAMTKTESRFESLTCCRSSQSQTVPLNTDKTVTDGWFYNAHLQPYLPAGAPLGLALVARLYLPLFQLPDVTTSRTLGYGH